MMDEGEVPVIGGMPVADGWKTVTVVVRGRSEDVFVAPDGERYVRAGELQHADLIYHRKSKRFSEPLHVRLRFEEGSPLARKIRREQRLETKNEQIANERRKARKVRRKR